jgi:uncharacterized lipoprotein NlpE involved in copper resistance
MYSETSAIWVQKIIITLLILITLTSCNEKQEIENVVENEVVKNIEKIENNNISKNEIIEEVVEEKTSS